MSLGGAGELQPLKLWAQESTVREAPTMTSPCTTLRESTVPTHIQRQRPRAFEINKIKKFKKCKSCDPFVVVQFSSVQSLSRVRLFATPWTAAPQASLSITNSWSLLKLMSLEFVMPSNHLILCHPFSSCLQSFPASGSLPTTK